MNKSILLKQRRTFICSLIIILACTGLVRVTGAQDNQIILAVGEWPPHTYADTSGRGISSEIVAAALSAAGYEYKWIAAPWKRCEEMVNQGFATATYPYRKTPEREITYLFSKPFLTSPAHIFHRVGTHLVTHKHELQGKHIALQSGSYFEKEIAEMTTFLITTETLDQAISMLAKGRVEYVITSADVGWETIRNIYPTQSTAFTTSPLVYLDKPFHLMISRAIEAPETFLLQFDEGLDTIKANGTYDAILKGKSL